MRSLVNSPDMPLRMQVKNAIGRVFGLFRSFRNRRDVLRLAELDDRTLHDIGLTRSDVLAALAEPVHRDPSIRLLVRRIDGRARERAVRSTAQAPLTLPSPATCMGR